MSPDENNFKQPICKNCDNEYPPSIFEDDNGYCSSECEIRELKFKLKKATYIIEHNIIWMESIQLDNASYRILEKDIEKAKTFLKDIEKKQ